jgi:Fe-S cluster assembly ATP-binding protein
MLEIKNLHVKVEDKDILKGINLTVHPGELHAIMGRNGSGKSTLANVIAGQESYEITSGDILYNGTSIIAESPEERALAGIFMSFQYPVIIPGVNNTYFLKAALNAIRKHQGKTELDAVEFLKLIRKKLAAVETSNCRD